MYGGRGGREEKRGGSKGDEAGCYGGRCGQLLLKLLNNPRAAAQEATYGGVLWKRKLRMRRKKWECGAAVKAGILHVNPNSALLGMVPVVEKLQAMRLRSMCFITRDNDDEYLSGG